MVLLMISSKNFTVPLYTSLNISSNIFCCFFCNICRHENIFPMHDNNFVAYIYQGTNKLCAFETCVVTRDYSVNTLRHICCIISISLVTFLCLIIPIMSQNMCQNRWCIWDSACFRFPINLQHENIFSQNRVLKFS